jgi:hypothetical protein
LVSVVLQAGWASRLIWMGEEYLVPTGIWFPDGPACSSSPYWLCYPGPLVVRGLVYMLSFQCLGGTSCLHIQVSTICTVPYLWSPHLSGLKLFHAFESVM